METPWLSVSGAIAVRKRRVPESPRRGSKAPRRFGIPSDRAERREP
jgi:hypothetical protein